MNKKQQALFSRDVLRRIAKDHAIKAEEILEHRDARVQLFKSMHEAGNTVACVAQTFGVDPASLLRMLRARYPEAFPTKLGRGRFPASGVDPLKAKPKKKAGKKKTSKAKKPATKKKAKPAAKKKKTKASA